MPFILFSQTKKLLFLFPILGINLADFVFLRYTNFVLQPIRRS